MNLTTHLLKARPQSAIPYDRSLAAAQGSLTRRRVADARNTLKRHWADHGSSYSYLVSKPEDNAKLGKSGAGGGVPTYGLTLAPAREASKLQCSCGAPMVRRLNTCPNATPTCTAGCLNTAGKGELARVQRGRAIKTHAWIVEPDACVTVLTAEIHRAVDLWGSIRQRLNVLSDAEWERILPDLFDATAGEVAFYDYTKIRDRYERFLAGELPTNYHLTFSASERTSDADIADIVSRGGNVAVVFAKYVPATWLGLPVVNGDLSDDRVSDPRGVIVGLKAKGKMRHPSYVERGFVRVPEKG
jgi:hypothetical protein